jgi:hypothetical protein
MIPLFLFIVEFLRGSRLLNIKTRVNFANIKGKPTIVHNKTLNEYNNNIQENNGY